MMMGLVQHILTCPVIIVHQNTFAVTEQTADHLGRVSSVIENAGISREETFHGGFSTPTFVKHLMESQLKLCCSSLMSLSSMEDTVVEALFV